MASDIAQHRRNQFYDHANSRAARAKPKHDPIEALKRTHREQRQELTDKQLKENNAFDMKVSDEKANDKGFRNGARLAPEQERDFKERRERLYKQHKDAMNSLVVRQRRELDHAVKQHPVD